MTDYLPYLGDVLAGIATAESAERRQAFDRLLRTGAQLAWDAARPQLVEESKAQLGKGDLIAHGVTLSEIELTFGQDVKLARAPGASSTTGEIPMQLRVGPNLITAKSTTPSVFGSYADPRFSLDFGIAIDFSLIVEAKRMFLSTRVDSAHITGADFTGNPHLDSQNLPADIGKFLLDSVLPWFGGPNYVSIVESVIGRLDFAKVLNAALQPVNNLLGELAKQGMGSVIALFPDAAAPAGVSGQALALGGPSPESAPLLVLARPLSGDGVARGEIRWPKSAGAPQLDPPYTDAFAISATAETGAVSGQFAQPTNVTHIGSFEYASTESDHVLSYSLVGLPIDTPITIECVANAKIPWSGDPTKTPSPERDGWNGRVTIHPGVEVTGRFRGERERIASPAEEVELNPQPIPPGRAARSRRIEQESTTPAAEVELNPQPIPPGRAGRLGHIEQSSTPIPASELAGGRGPLRRYTSGEVDPISAGIVRQDPSGAGQVDGINFAVHLLDRPR